MIRFETASEQAVKKAQPRAMINQFIRCPYFSNHSHQDLRTIPVAVVTPAKAGVQKEEAGFRLSPE
jgi:hypothetical protein